MGMALALFSSFQWKKRSAKVRVRRNRKRRRVDVDRVTPEIPLDLQIEILTRLPAKSLMRFKCVSKHWYSLICCQYFSNLRLTVASQQQLPRLYMSLVNCYNPDEYILLSASPSSSSSFDQDFTMQGLGGRDMVVLRGLILYTVCRNACIYNPTTGQNVTLPDVKSDIFSLKKSTVFYFFGHDPVLDQYKVVCIVVRPSKHLKRITSEHWVLVLEAGCSWKRIEFDHQRHYPTERGLCIDGVIYYLAMTRASRDIVFSFDVRSEELNMIQVPDVVEYCESVGFIEYGGKPAIFDHTHLGENGLVNLWVLEDGGNWSIKSLVLKPCQMHLVDDRNIPLIVEGTADNGEVILVPRVVISPYYILYYDLQNNDLRKVDITGIPNDGSYFYLRLMDNKIQNFMHFET